jgi:hypothetical protein
MSLFIRVHSCPFAVRLSVPGDDGVPIAKQLDSEEDTVLDVSASESPSPLNLLTAVFTRRKPDAPNQSQQHHYQL